MCEVEGKGSIASLTFPDNVKYSFANTTYK